MGNVKYDKPNRTFDFKVDDIYDKYTLQFWLTEQEDEALYRGPHWTDENQCFKIRFTGGIIKTEYDVGFFAPGFNDTHISNIVFQVYMKFLSDKIDKVLLED